MHEVRPIKRWFYLSLVWKNTTGPHRALTSASSNIFRMNLNYLSSTSKMLFWLNGSISKILAKQRRLKQPQIDAKGFGDVLRSHMDVFILLDMDCIVLRLCPCLISLTFFFCPLSCSYFSLYSDSFFFASLGSSL